ncbi:hypothetical protein AAVH_30566 [Aphelenchoides avenae]|nr:hypothetical protein AAVH_30566 [Aphelenchus avenae]
MFQLKGDINACDARRKCHTNGLYAESSRVAELKKKITDLKRPFGQKSDKWNEGTVKYLYATTSDIQRVEA